MYAIKYGASCPLRQEEANKPCPHFFVEESYDILVLLVVLKDCEAVGYLHLINSCNPYLAGYIKIDMLLILINLMAS